MTQQPRDELTAAQEAEVEALIARFAELSEVAALFPPPRLVAIQKALRDGAENLMRREEAE